MCHNSAGSGETGKMGRKSRNQDLKPGQIHSNVSRDLESQAQILTGRGNLGRKHLFSKNNNRGASILRGTVIHAQEAGGKAWPLALSSLGRFEMGAFHLCSLPRWPSQIVVNIYVYFSFTFIVYVWTPPSSPRTFTYSLPAAETRLGMDEGGHSCIHACQ